MHPILEIFEQIAAIPHGSRNEQALSDYLVRYARERGFKVYQDDVQNVIIKLPASAGRENAAAVILQGHMDMVCEKSAASAHDFTKDPLTLVYDGDSLHADGTTLGADNAIALAYGLALLESDAPHPPVELLFTVDEESSMKGVKSFDPALFDGRMLINLDSAGEGMLTVSCAGGIGVDYHIPITLVPAAGDAYRLTVSGLLGGHSGGEIDKERGNANKLLCRVLTDMREHAGTSIAFIEGGTKTNAIPLAAYALVTLERPEHAAALAEKWNSILGKEYLASDPGVCVTLERSAETIARVFDAQTADRLLCAVNLTLSGVDRWDKQLGIVMDSSSMGIVRTENGSVLVKNNLRSSSGTLLEKLTDEMRMIARLLGLEVTVESPYPAWEYLPESRLRTCAIAAYQELHHAEPKVIAIHAGLEIGYLAQKLPGLDAISFGPDTTGGHTTSEQLSVRSFISTYEYLLKILDMIR